MLNYGGVGGGTYGGAGSVIAGIASLTGGSIIGTNVAYDLAKWAVPVGISSSGSMGNNGAMSAITAMPTTYSGGIWLFFQASAIFAGSAAGFYWVVMSSTTAGTVFNSTYSGTGVPGLGTQTAFVTTGPGAFTGFTGTQGVTIPVGAGVIGANGYVEIAAGWAYTNSVNNKTPVIKLGGSGGTQFFAINRTTTVEDSLEITISNVASQAVQKSYTESQGNTLGGSGEPSASYKATGTVDTSLATSVFVGITTANAADNAIVESGRVRVGFGA